MRHASTIHLAPVFERLGDARKVLYDANAAVEASTQRLDQETLDQERTRREAFVASGECARAERIAQDLAFIVATGEAANEGDQLAIYANSIFKLSGKSPERADREADMLRLLADDAELTPALIGDRVTIFGSSETDSGEIKGNSVEAINDGELGELAIKVHGPADQFGHSAFWRWQRSGIDFPVRLSAKEVVVTDDKDEVYTALEVGDPLIAVGYDAVEAALDKVKTSSVDPGYEEAVKYLINRAMGRADADVPFDGKRLSTEYDETLYQQVSHGRIGSSSLSDLPASLHPDIRRLDTRPNSDIIRGNIMASALMRNMTKATSDGQKIHSLDWWGRPSDVLFPLARLIENYSIILSRRGQDSLDFPMSDDRSKALTRTFARVARNNLLQGSGMLTRFGREARELKKIADSDSLLIG